MSTSYWPTAPKPPKDESWTPATPPVQIRTLLWVITALLALLVLFTFVIAMALAGPTIRNHVSLRDGGAEGDMVHVWTP